MLGYPDISLNIIHLIILLMISFIIGLALSWLVNYLRNNSKKEIDKLLTSHQELEYQLKAINNNFQSSQHFFDKKIQDNFSGITQQLHENFHKQAKFQYQHMSNLQEKLGIIDNAQKNIQSLASEVVQLQHILSNKHTRGTFGQGRMEALICDALPNNLYKFQHTLSNGSRPDCIIKLPNGPCLIIDAKFPLESWHKFRSLTDEKEIQLAYKQFSRDMIKHITDISDKYLITGETYDSAFMFIPSESIFADIQEYYQDIVQRAYKNRVIIVSPSLLLLSIQVIQSMFKDARMNEQALLIQIEVEKMAKDISRLDERVQKLASHFHLTTKDIDEILISTKKITKASDKIMTKDLTLETSDTSTNKLLLQTESIDK
ncbi:DNA recombination protein RmuC [Bartonella sp. DGB1]|uniref:DNA recombination protein RmuC n=1 Tax=Bartonella sp. DGB1 TaxID=3239807 RepID=UPI00352343AC